MMNEQDEGARVLQQLSPLWSPAFPDSADEKKEEQAIPQFPPKAQHLCDNNNNVNQGCQYNRKKAKQNFVAYDRLKVVDQLDSDDDDDNEQAHRNGVKGQGGKKANNKRKQQRNKNATTLYEVSGIHDRRNHPYTSRQEYLVHFKGAAGASKSNTNNNTNTSSNSADDDNGGELVWEPRQSFGHSAQQLLSNFDVCAEDADYQRLCVEEADGSSRHQKTYMREKRTRNEKASNSDVDQEEMEQEQLTKFVRFRNVEKNDISTSSISSSSKLSCRYPSEVLMDGVRHWLGYSTYVYNTDDAKTKGKSNTKSESQNSKNSKKKKKFAQICHINADKRKSGNKNNGGRSHQQNGRECVSDDAEEQDDGSASSSSSNSDAALLSDSNEALQMLESGKHGLDEHIVAQAFLGDPDAINEFSVFQQQSQQQQQQQQLQAPPTKGAGLVQNAVAVHSEFTAWKAKHQPAVVHNENDARGETEQAPGENGDERWTNGEDETGDGGGGDDADTGGKQQSKCFVNDRLNDTLHALVPGNDFFRIRQDDEEEEQEEKQLHGAHGEMDMATWPILRLHQFHSQPTPEEIREHGESMRLFCRAAMEEARWRAGPQSAASGFIRLTGRGAIKDKGSIVDDASRWIKENLVVVLRAPDAWQHEFATAQQEQEGEGCVDSSTTTIGQQQTLAELVSECNSFFVSFNKNAIGDNSDGDAKEENGGEENNRRAAGVVEVRVPLDEYRLVYPSKLVAFLLNKAMVVAL